MINLMQGDCMESLKKIPDNSVDLILTDPPYELGFMGKKWDNTGIAYSEELWREALRVLKPGGYLMAFSGARTYHRMASAINDSGFDVRDMINWTYGSGFPKSLDISKAIDKKLGLEREIISTEIRNNYPSGIVNIGQGEVKKIERKITAPSSDIAKQYKGYKTALKPSHEPICLAMKPLSEKNFVENVMKWGTGGLNVDGCRIGSEKIVVKGGDENTEKFFGGGFKEVNIERTGRYPANTIISEDLAPIMDEQSGFSKSSPNNVKGKYSDNENGATAFKRGENTNYSDQGGASRFFYNAKIEEGDYIPFYYTAKCSKTERNSDVNGEPISGEAKAKVFNGKSNSKSKDMKDVEKRFTTQPMVNNHPTVKPKSILKFLATLGLPPHDSVVLDMFSGSGSTGLAVEELNKETGMNHTCILMEREEEYIEIIKKRLCLMED